MKENILAILQIVGIHLTPGCQTSVGISLENCVPCSLLLLILKQEEQAPEKVQNSVEWLRESSLCHSLPTALLVYIWYIEKKEESKLFFSLFVILLEIFCSELRNYFVICFQVLTLLFICLISVICSSLFAFLYCIVPDFPTQEYCTHKIILSFGIPFLPQLAMCCICSVFVDCSVHYFL